MDDLLDCPMQPNSAEAATIREYLLTLLLEVWNEGEGFSGKRPFGDSGWENDIYIALGQQGYIKCVVDEDGYVYDVDSSAADKLIADAILGMR